MSWSFWARVSCISWNLKTDGTVGHGRSGVRARMNPTNTLRTSTLWLLTRERVHKAPLRMCIPVIRLLQKLLQTLKFTHLQVGFIRVLVTNERAATGGRQQREKAEKCWICETEESERLCETVDENQAERRDCKGIKAAVWRRTIITVNCVCTYSPVFGVWTLDVLAFLEVSLQVHGEQRRAGRIVRAANRPVVATDLVLSAEVIDRWHL